MVTGMAENVTSFAENVTSVAENVTAFAENITTFTENVTAFANETSTAKEPARIEDSFQYKLAVEIYYYMPIFSVSLGIPGNLVTFVVILRMRPFTTSSFLFCGMALSDLLYMCSSAFYRAQDKSLELLRAACIAGDYLTWTFSLFSLVFSLALATERAMAVWVPLKVSSIITMKRCVVVISICLVISSTVYLFYLFMNEMKYIPEIKDYDCTTKQEFETFYVGYWWYSNIILTSLGPVTIFVTCNVVILVGLRRSKQLQQQMRSDDVQLKEKAKQSRQVTVMLMAGLTLFILTNFPVSIVFVSFKVRSSNSGSAEHLWMILFSTTTVTIRDYNHALNGYCYFFTAKRFRRGVIDLLTCGGRMKVKGMGKKASRQGMTSTFVTESTTASTGKE